MVALAVVVACGDATGPSGAVDLRGGWAEVAPEAAGLDGAQLETAAEQGAAIPRLRSLLVARGGRLAFERYFGGADRDTRFDVRSVTKSIVSSLAGIALDEGTLPGLDQSVAPWLAGFTLDAQDELVTVRHLLSMTSGYQWDEWTGPSYTTWWNSSDHVQYVLSQPHAAAPGSVYTYNSGAVHLLGVILGRAAGSGLPAYAQDRLFRYAGIGSAEWEPFEHNTVNGGAGIDLTGRDLLRFGQLWLQRGRSGSRQVIPEAWVDAATTPQSNFMGSAGPMSGVRYGYLWWLWPARGAFFAWGYGGQFVYVVPDDDLVVVATTDWRSLTETTPYAVESAVLSVIVSGVLPAVRDAAQAARRSAGRAATLRRAR